MAARGFASVVEWLRVTSRQAEGDLADSDLLRRYATSSDAEAFAELVRRHGPMVLGVCGRVLLHRHDQEDAFQATFLVLARRARAIARPRLLANWLYGAAYRTALEMRRRRIRRRTQPLGDIAILPDDELATRELRSLIDEEIARLSEKLRTVFVLCHLEEQTHEEAAQVLGCPPGTVASRLAQARERLRTRLTRRGITLSAGLAAVVPAELLAAATRVGADVPAESIRLVAEGVVKAMVIDQLKKGACLVLCAAFLVAAAGIIYRASQAEPAQAQAQGEGVAEAKVVDADPKTEEVASIEVFEAFASNDALADETFVGKVLQVKGALKRIQREGREELAKYMLTMYAGPAEHVQPRELYFEFTSQHRKALAALRAGDTVTIEGHCLGRENRAVSIVFTESKIIRVQPGTRSGDAGDR